jgi:acyl dehydratase
MNPMNYQRLRGNRKALSAALGVGVLITMGALTLSGLARNFGDVFGAGSGSERAVGVIVGGDALE